MIEIVNIVTGYNKKPILNNLSLRLGEGEFCSILGPNGAGKSTLLKAIIGFQPLWEGDILFNGRSIVTISHKELARLVAIIPQEIHLQFDYPVKELVLMGRYPYLNYWEKYSRQDKEIVDIILNELKLQEFRNKNYSQLSGGEKQRVNIARALAQNSKAILLDESLVHLDINHQLETIHLLAQINKSQRKTIVIVSHNINLAADYSERMIFLKKGQVALDGAPEEVVNQKSINDIYGAELNILINQISGKPNIQYPGWK